MARMILIWFILSVAIGAGIAAWLRMPDYSSRCDELTDEQRRANATRADQLLMNK
jgi:hypothetical protein